MEFIEGIMAFGPLAAGVTAKAASGIGGALLGGLGNVIGGLFGKSGQSSANAANRALARENREWQERMSNTAYQRSAADLKKAGLNRILAIGQPSSTPAGNVATMENVNAPAQEGISSGISSGITAAMAKATIDNTNARTENVRAQTRVLGGPAEVGDTLGEIAVTAKQQGKRLLDEYGYKTKPRVQATMTQSLKERQNTQRINNIAKSFGMSPNLMNQELKRAAKGMDLPNRWSEADKIKYILDNPDRLKRWMERNKR